MDYSLNVGKTVKRMLPVFLRKPFNTQWITALTYPLNYINQLFLAFTSEKITEAYMSSQTMILENYLNTIFIDYVLGSGTIRITHSDPVGTPFYFEAEVDNVDPVIFGSEEDPGELDLVTLYFLTENQGVLPVDFRVNCPVHLSGNEEFERELINVIERYRMAGFTYDVVYN